MFRDLTRKKQQLSPEICTELLKTLPRGVLSVIGDGGYPYATPMNHYFCEEDGCIYFHCGRKGHRLDALRACDKVSFCGGVDTQELLPNGTPEAVMAKVKELREIFPTGLIISPSHEAVQSDVPPQNIEAMFKETNKVY